MNQTPLSAINQNKRINVSDIDQIHIQQQNQSPELTPEMYKHITDSVNDVIWIIELGTLKFLYQSPSVKRLRGYTPEEAIAFTLEETITPSSVNLALKTITEELLNESDPTTDPNRSRVLELEHYCKDGSTIIAESTLSFLRNADGKPTGILGVTRDISIRKKETNRTIEILLEKRTLDRKTIEKNMMSNSRDLISPLIEMLKSSGLNRRQKEMVSMIETALEQLTLPFTRELSSPRYNLTRREILVASLIREGKGSKEIAGHMNLSLRTVDNHRYNIRKKLGINNEKNSLTSVLMSFE